MRFDLINPSDPYTFDAPDLLIAAVVVVILGHGKYGANEIGGAADASEVVPIMLIGDPDHWFQTACGETLEGALHIAHQPRRNDLIAALRSVTIGSLDERRLLDEALARIEDDDARRKHADQWHDSKRSSINDIGRLARSLADDIEEEVHESTRNL